MIYCRWCQRSPCKFIVLKTGPATVSLALVKAAGRASLSEEVARPTTISQSNRGPGRTLLGRTGIRTWEALIPASVARAGSVVPYEARLSPITARVSPKAWLSSNPTRYLAPRRTTCLTVAEPASLIRSTRSATRERTGIGSKTSTVIRKPLAEISRQLALAYLRTHLRIFRRNSCWADVQHANAAEDRFLKCVAPISTRRF